MKRIMLGMALSLMTGCASGSTLSDGAPLATLFEQFQLQNQASETAGHVMDAVRRNEDLRQQGRLPQTINLSPDAYMDYRV